MNQPPFINIGVSPAKNKDRTPFPLKLRRENNIFFFSMEAKGENGVSVKPKALGLVHVHEPLGTRRVHPAKLLQRRVGGPGVAQPLHKLRDPEGF